MNAIVNKILLAGDTFMQGTHLRQAGFTYSACGSFTKNKEWIINLRKQEIYYIIIYINIYLIHIYSYTYIHLVLLKSQNMIDINVELLQWSINVW